MDNTFKIIIYNCEGIRRTSDYLSQLVKLHSHDTVCLQETWLLDSTLCYLNTINDDICTGIAGVDSYDSIIRERSKGGGVCVVAIMYHKNIAKHITHIKSTIRRVCGIILNYENFFSCMLLNLYDNFSNVQITDGYINCIEYVESMFNSSNCDACICCGDLNTSFERDNAQSRHLSEFNSRNYLLLSWDHVLSEKDFTYVNHSLSHKSCIDHFILSNNVYDHIVDNSVIFDSLDLSNHNIIELRISCLITKSTLDRHNCTQIILLNVPGISQHQLTWQITEMY